VTSCAFSARQTPEPVRRDDSPSDRSRVEHASHIRGRHDVSPVLLWFYHMPSSITREEIEQKMDELALELLRNPPPRNPRKDLQILPASNRWIRQTLVYHLCVAIASWATRAL